MLARRIIACLDVAEGRVVKGTQFINLRDVGDPVELARFYDAAGADELVFLDITASPTSRTQMLVGLIERLSEQVFIPLTIGGGIDACGKVNQLLRAGADKVAINTAGIKDPNLLAEAAEKFGRQCLVVAIDARRRPAHAGEHQGPRPLTTPLVRLALDDPPSPWEVVVEGGRTPTGVCAVGWAKKAAELGAGEILLTSIDTDGVREGFDCQLTEAVASQVTVPVIASGGAGCAADFVEVFTKTQATGALAAGIFHAKETSIKRVKRDCRDAGIAVRPPALEDNGVPGA